MKAYIVIRKVTNCFGTNTDIWNVFFKEEDAVACAKRLNNETDENISYTVEKHFAS